MKRLIQYLISAVVVFTMAFTQSAYAAENDRQDVSVVYSSNKLTIEGAPENTTVEVSNMLGVKVFITKTTNQYKNEYTVSFSKGFYIVRVGSDVKRIVVR